MIEPYTLFDPSILLGPCTAPKHISTNSNVQIFLMDHIWVHSSLDFHILISKHVVFLLHEVWYHNHITNFKEESCHIYNFLRTLFYLKNILLQKKYILTVIKTNKTGWKCFEGWDAFTFTNLFFDQEMFFNYRVMLNVGGVRSLLMWQFWKLPNFF